MLKNIKSKYILQKIFENINYERKLNIIKYSKILKIRLNITPDHYIINLINQKLKKKLYIKIESGFELNAKSAYIGEIGLEYLNKLSLLNLTKLDLSNTGISNINELEKLNTKKVRELNLSFNI